MKQRETPSQKMASAGGSDEVNKPNLHTLVPIILVLMENGVVFEKSTATLIGDTLW